MEAIILATTHQPRTAAEPVALTKACGVSLLERHIRVLRSCGIRRVDVIVKDDQVLTEYSRDFTQRGMSLNFHTLEDLRSYQTVIASQPVFIILGDFIVEKSLVEMVAKAEGECILVDSHPAGPVRQDSLVGSCPVFAGVGRLMGVNLSALVRRGDSFIRELISLDDVRRIDVNAMPSFDPDMRRDRRRYWTRIKNTDDLPDAEAQLIAGVQKGSLDWPAQVLHAPIENWAVDRLCRTSVTPNQLTLITNIVAWGVTALILAGYLMPALCLAAVVGIMDGVDGKLARLKLMTSKIGKLEHLFDMFFEYSWWFALGWVLSQGDPSAPVFIAGIALILCNFADTAAGIVFWYYKGRRHGRILENYTPFDLKFKKVAGRRNIYVWIILLTALVSNVETGLWVALIWGVVTVVVRGGRTLMHLRDRRGPVNFEFVVR